MAIDFHNLNLINGRKWLALTLKGSLTKLLRRDEIEEVDIAEACDWLHSAVMLQYSSIERMQVQAWPEVDGILFRNVVYLCFFVTRIYQQQITFLLDRCIELLRYCQFGNHIIKKFHSGSYMKSQTKIQTEYVPEVINTYEDLISQVMDLQQWARRLDLAVSQETAISSQDDHLLNEARFRLPRMLSSSNDFLDGVVPEFEEATPNEIAIFSDLFTTLRLDVTTAKQPVKRKFPFSDDVHMVKAKRVYIENCDGNNHRIFNVNTCKNFTEDTVLGNPYTGQILDDICYFDGAVDSFQNDLDSAPNSPLCFIEPTLIHSKSATRISRNDISYFDGAVDSFQNDLDAAPNSPFIEPTLIHTESATRKSRKKYTLAVDERTRIPNVEIKANVANIYICTRPTIRAAAGKIKKKRSANSLLSIKNCRKIKGLHLPKKPNMSNVESEQMYLNILYNIFGWYPSDDFAYIVCPKWRRVRKPRQNVVVPMDVDISDIGDIEEQTLGSIECNYESEWSIPDTLTKLLQQWLGGNANAPCTEIKFANFLPATNKRRSAVKAFASLLNLSAKGFIVMTKSKDTPTIETIRVGRQLETLQPTSFIENLWS